MTLAILLSVPGRVQFGVCCTGSTSEAEEELDAFAVVVAGKHFETAAARSFMELVLRCVFKFFVLFGVLWGKFIAGLSGEASWRGLPMWVLITSQCDRRDKATVLWGEGVCLGESSQSDSAMRRRGRGVGP